MPSNLHCVVVFVICGDGSKYIRVCVRARARVCLYVCVYVCVFVCVCHCACFYVWTCGMYVAYMVSMAADFSKIHRTVCSHDKTLSAFTIKA